MPKLPTDVSGRELRAILERVGFVLRRQRGSHMILRRPEPFARVVVPDHKSIRVGTLKQVLNQANLSVGEFLDLRAAR